MRYTYKHKHTIYKKIQPCYIIMALRQVHKSKIQIHTQKYNTHNYGNHKIHKYKI